MPTNELSSSGYATEPLVSLLKKPLNQMSEAELRQYAAELRQLRQQPQSLGRKLRKEQVEGEEGDEDDGIGMEVDVGTKTRKSAKPAPSLDDLMKSLE